MRIGVVACGYADGYPRLAPGTTPARRCSSTACARARVGRVSMDMITVDLTPVREARVGSVVVALGPGRQRRGAGDRRGRAGGRHGRLRADVRARAARADARRLSASAMRRCPRRRRVARSSSRRCGPRAPAARTSTRSRARSTCASTSRPPRCPTDQGAPARAARSAHHDEGVIVIKAQRHRSQDMNRRDALARLNALVATRPTCRRRVGRPGRRAARG